MSEHVRIVTLIENNAETGSGLVSEHGLAFYIEIDGLKIIFDTGQSDAFLENARKLNIDLTSLDYIIMSHGHYDHSGGLLAMISQCTNKPKLIVGEGFFNQKYKRLGLGLLKNIGNGFDEGKIGAFGISISQIKDDQMTLCTSVMLHRKFRQDNRFEIINNQFVLMENQEEKVDTFEDEVVLSIHTSKGLLVLVGCAHVGIVNILQTIKNREIEPIWGVMGGTHLVDVSEERLKATIYFFQKEGYKFVATGHCTDEKSVSMIEEVMKEQFMRMYTGLQLNLLREE